MAEREGKNQNGNNQTKLLAKLPPDWEKLSDEERRDWTAALAAQLLEKFRNSQS
jgi:hypothetical protein